MTDPLHQVLAIEPTAYEDLLRLARSGAKDRSATGAESLDIDPLTGIATLNITGPMSPYPGEIARKFGAVDSVALERLARQAADSPDVSALILRIASPGGTVNGTPELSDAIAHAAGKKPVFAFTDTMAASAAYWIAAPATGLYGTASAHWGSVGVIRPHVDLTGAYEQEGMRIEIFRSGPMKAPGTLGTSLTDEQREAFQAEVDAIGEQFREHVLKYRPDAQESALDGRTFSTAQAVEQGLVTGIVANYSQFLALVSQEVDTRQKSTATTKPKTTATMPDPDKLAALEDSLNALTTRVTAAEERASNAETKANEAEAKANEAQTKLAETETKLAAAEAKAATAETEAKEAKELAKQAEGSTNLRVARIAAGARVSPLNITIEAKDEEEKPDFSKMKPREKWAYAATLQPEARAAFVKEHLS